MLISQKQLSVKTQELQNKVQLLYQTPIDKYEKIIFQYEQKLQNILNLFKPNIICKYDDERLYQYICQSRFTEYQQLKYLGKSFYIKQKSDRFIEIDPILVNATDDEIEKFKNKIECLQNEILSKNNLQEVFTTQQELYQLQNDLNLIQFSKQHNTNQFPIFDSIYQDTTKDYFLENKHVILKKLYESKKFIHLFEHKTYFSIYDIIDWENIEYNAIIDKNRISQEINIKNNHLDQLDAIFVKTDLRYNYDLFLQIYRGSSFNKQENIFNVIGKVNHNTIEWNLPNHLYDISPFVITKAKAGLTKNSNWDVIGFIESIKEWTIKQIILHNNIKGLIEFLNNN
jgi:hypothetical protein